MVYVLVVQYYQVAGALLSGDTVSSDSSAVVEKFGVTTEEPDGRASFDYHCCDELGDVVEQCVLALEYTAELVLFEFELTKTTESVDSGPGVVCWCCFQ